MKTRLPAEWEEQDGVLLSWPHAESDWRIHLEVVEPVFIEIVRQVSRFEKVLITAPDPETVRMSLAGAGIFMERVRLFRIDSNDTWARDFGPVTVLEDGQPFLLDFSDRNSGSSTAVISLRRFNPCGIRPAVLSAKASAAPFM